MYQSIWTPVTYAIVYVARLINMHMYNIYCRESAKVFKLPCPPHILGEGTDGLPSAGSPDVRLSVDYITMFFFAD